MGSLPFHWFPTTQSNFIHMSLPQLPSKMLIDGDWNYLHRCAMALYNLESRMVNIPTIYCKGEWSARIVEMLKIRRKVFFKVNKFLIKKIGRRKI